ncbi:D-aspartate ligase [Gammaproteobacteria bacterium]
MPNLPTAVVVGVEVNGLGILRSLSLGDVPLIAADQDTCQSTMRTRHGRKVKLRALSGVALIEDLLTLAKELDHTAVLFLTRDESVATVSEYREMLAPHYRFQLPPHNVVRDLNTKPGFQSIATQGDFPIPPGVQITCEADLPKLQNLPYPCALKPAERNEAYDRQFEKAYRIESVKEAIELCRRILPIMPDLLVQQWIEGQEDDIYFVLQYHPGNGQSPLSFTGRKVWSWPPLVGVAACCGPALFPLLESLTTRFFQHCQVEGWAAMEYKRDSRTGNFLMVEPSVGRSEMLAEVATLNGTNLPLAAYLWQIGQTPPISKQSPIIFWQRDFLSNYRAKRLRPISCLPKDAKIVDGYWRIDDPIPAILDYPKRLFFGVARLFGKIQ